MSSTLAGLHCRSVSVTYMLVAYSHIPKCAFKYFLEIERSCALSSYVQSVALATVAETAQV